uniref:Eukaryotic translation initiation factor 2A n=1 Tax=Salarias fasciatus TaxID=181472 RepID=A0A672H8W6_SALFA
MAPPIPLLAVRASDGTSLLCGPPQCEQYAAFQRDPQVSRCVTFNRDGTLFAWCNGQKVSVVKSVDGSVLLALDLPKTALLDFSPLSNILVTWQPYTKGPNCPQGDANLQLWDISSGQLIKSLFQKKVESWCPTWSEDEKICVRSVNNELHFYEDNDFTQIANKLHMQKVSSFTLSPGVQPSKVSIYVPGSKGAPSFVRLYQYPALGGPTAALANKSFFKADKVWMQWNQKASAVLVTASTEVDKSGASYYGEQTLHYLAVNGETALVQLRKTVRSTTWRGPPSSTSSVIPPQGHILVLAGFGNLHGQMEVWDMKKFKQVSKPQAADSTYFSWCPDGEHVVTATCSPRLRVGNGFKIWHYTGSVLHTWSAAPGTELWEVAWQPFPAGVFPERPVTYQAPPTQLGSTQAPPTQAYRPPALRHLPASASTKLHEDEAPKDLRPGASAEKTMSKTALKNQRKREAKKAAKQETKPEPPSEPAPVTNNQSEPSSGDPETDKKIKNLKKVKNHRQNLRLGVRQKSVPPPLQSPLCAMM